MNFIVAGYTVIVVTHAPGLLPPDVKMLVSIGEAGLKIIWGVLAIGTPYGTPAPGT